MPWVGIAIWIMMGMALAFFLVMHSDKKMSDAQCLALFGICILFWPALVIAMAFYSLTS